MNSARPAGSRVHAVRKRLWDVYLCANGIFQSALESYLLFELVKCSNCVSAAVQIEFEAFLSMVLTFGAVAVNRALERSSAPFGSCFVMMLLFGALLTYRTDR